MFPNKGQIGCPNVIHRVFFALFSLKTHFKVLILHCSMQIHFLSYEAVKAMFTTKAALKSFNRRSENSGEARPSSMARRSESAETAGANLLTLHFQLTYILHACRVGRNYRKPIPFAEAMYILIDSPRSCTLF